MHNPSATGKLHSTEIQQLVGCSNWKIRGGFGKSNFYCLIVTIATLLEVENERSCKE